MRNRKLQKAQDYWQQATNFVRLASDSGKATNWFAITLEMPQQIDAWRDYFKWRIGFAAVGLDMLSAQRIECFLVPTEWPEWFDTQYKRGGAYD